MNHGGLALYISCTDTFVRKRWITEVLLSGTFNRKRWTTEVLLSASLVQAPLDAREESLRSCSYKHSRCRQFRALWPACDWESVVYDDVWRLWRWLSVVPSPLYFTVAWWTNGRGLSNTHQLCHTHINFVLHELSDQLRGLSNTHQLYHTHTHSPWYNRHGWLGVKNQLSIYLSTIPTFVLHELSDQWEVCQTLISFTIPTFVLHELSDQWEVFQTLISFTIPTLFCSARVVCPLVVLAETIFPCHF